MPRDRKRKTNIGQHTENDMREALVKISEGLKIKAVAKLMNIPYTTLYRYNQKIKNSTSIDPILTERLTPNYSVRRVFTDAQEEKLEEYLTTCSNMYYGLTIEDTRKLAYEMATINNISVPEKWHQTKLAGIDWLYNFRQRHPTITLRTPEGCSLSRATSFNRHNVGLFFDNLENVMKREEAFGNGTRVFNLDETNTMTVQKPAKVLAVKGQKQVSKVTSAERGTLVTTCYIVNALGNTLPPVMIFPRVHFKNHMIKEAPAGTLGLATQSGWMNGELFVQTMQHFITLTNSTKNNPSLLVLDNHESHISIEVLNLAKENGVTVLTFPPHSTGKLQPLDVGVFGPFKVAYNKAVDSWMMRHPGQTFSIYDVAGCVKEAHMKSMTPNNIVNAFKATGIFPYNRDIFTDDDFAPSNVTNREQEKENEIPDNRTEELDDNHNIGNEDGDRTRTPSPSVLLPSDHVQPSSCPPSKLSDVQIAPSNLNKLPLLSELAFQVFEQSTSKSTIKTRESTSSAPARRGDPPKKPEGKPSTSKAGNKLANKTTLKFVDSGPFTSRNISVTPKQFTSPLEFRGLPKAEPRKRGRAGRRKGKSMIATDTPNKDEIKQRAEEKNKSKKRKKAANVVKKRVLESDSEEEEEDKMSVYSEEEAGSVFDKENEIIHVDHTTFRPLKTNPKEGNFILVEFKAKEKKIYYIGKVIGEKKEDIEVSFLRKSVKNTNNFHVPNVPDIATVAFQDIKMILPQPGFSGRTKRTQGLYHFDIDFSGIDLR